MSEAKTYTGGCHCGNVKYEVNLALGQVMECNCSMCSKRGGLLAFAPRDQFKLLSGEGKTTEYLFNKKQLHHHFCPTCGIASFSFGAKDGHPMVAVNTRCLDGVDPHALEVKQVDGKRF